MSEWIAWKPERGARFSLPVERGALVDVQYRDGGQRLGVPAGKDTGLAWRDAEMRFWVNDRHHSDIVAWRFAEEPTP